MGFSFVDPFDQQALNVLEDKLGVRCSCAQRGNPTYCDIHNGARLVDALDRADFAGPAEVERRIEEAKEKWEAEKDKKVEAAVRRLQEAADAIADGTEKDPDGDPPDETWWKEWKLKAEKVIKDLEGT